MHSEMGQAVAGGKRVPSQGARVACDHWVGPEAEGMVLLLKQQPEKQGSILQESVCCSWRVPELCSQGEKTSNVVGENQACQGPGLLAHTLTRYGNRHVCMHIYVYTYAICRVCLRTNITALSMEGLGSSQAQR